MTSQYRDLQAADSPKGGVDLAPDFALVDTDGRLVRLSSYRNKAHVVLVFNRGFG